MPSIPSQKPDGPPQRTQGWVDRFSVAFRGIRIAVVGEVSFHVHLFITVVVLAAGVGLGLVRWEWCIAVLCIATVFCAELLNTAIEKMALAITRKEDDNIRDALDIASGGVLVMALGATVVGVLLFGSRVAELLGN